MLRLVKLNLYNFRLYKKMLDEVRDQKIFNELSNLLIYENLSPSEIIKKLEKEEKTGTNNLEPGSNYYLFDTKTNAYIGLIRISYFHKIIKENYFDVVYKIFEKYDSKELEKWLIDTINNLYYKRNKSYPIFKIYLEEKLSLDSFSFKEFNLILKEESFSLFKKVSD